MTLVAEGVIYAELRFAPLLHTEHQMAPEDAVEAVLAAAQDATVATDIDVAPARIGHGVRSIEDPALVERLATVGTHLEICPTCNVQLGVVPSLRRHPIDALYRRGVSLGISTDNRTTTPTTLTDEYTAIATTFAWQREDFAAINEMAARAIFATDKTANTSSTASANDTPCQPAPNNGPWACAEAIRAC